MYANITFQEKRMFLYMCINYMYTYLKKIGVILFFCFIFLLFFIIFLTFLLLFIAFSFLFITFYFAYFLFLKIFIIFHFTFFFLLENWKLFFCKIKKTNLTFVHCLNSCQNWKFFILFFFIFTSCSYKNYYLFS